MSSNNKSKGKGKGRMLTSSNSEGTNSVSKTQRDIRDCFNRSSSYKRDTKSISKTYVLEKYASGSIHDSNGKIDYKVEFKMSKNEKRFLNIGLPLPSDENKAFSHTSQDIGITKHIGNLPQVYFILDENRPHNLHIRLYNDNENDDDNDNDDDDDDNDTTIYCSIFGRESYHDKISRSPQNEKRLFGKKSIAMSDQDRLVLDASSSGQSPEFVFIFKEKLVYDKSPPRQVSSTSSSSSFSSLSQSLSREKAMVNNTTRTPLSPSSKSKKKVSTPVMLSFDTDNNNNNNNTDNHNHNDNDNDNDNHTTPVKKRSKMVNHSNSSKVVQQDKNITPVIQRPNKWDRKFDPNYQPPSVKVEQLETLHENTFSSGSSSSLSSVVACKYDNNNNNNNKRNTLIDLTISSSEEDEVIDVTLIDKEEQMRIQQNIENQKLNKNNDSENNNHKINDIIDLDAVDGNSELLDLEHQAAIEREIAHENEKRNKKNIITSATTSAAVATTTTTTTTNPHNNSNTANISRSNNPKLMLMKLKVGDRASCQASSGKGKFYPKGSVEIKKVNEQTYDVKYIGVETVTRKNVHPDDLILLKNDDNDDNDNDDDDDDEDIYLPAKKDRRKSRSPPNIINSSHKKKQKINVPAPKIGMFVDTVLMSREKETGKICNVVPNSDGTSWQVTVEYSENQYRKEALENEDFTYPSKLITIIDNDLIVAEKAEDSRELYFSPGFVNGKFKDKLRLVPDTPESSRKGGIRPQKLLVTRLLMDNENDKDLNFDDDGYDGNEDLFDNETGMKGRNIRFITCPICKKKYNQNRNASSSYKLASDITDHINGCQRLSIRREIEDIDSVVFKIGKNKKTLAAELKSSRTLEGQLKNEDPFMLSIVANSIDRFTSEPYNLNPPQSFYERLHDLLSDTRSTICFSKKNFYYNILKNLQDNFPCDQIINAWKPVNPLLFEDTIKSIGSETNIRKLYSNVLLLKSWLQLFTIESEGNYRDIKMERDDTILGKMLLGIVDCDIHAIVIHVIDTWRKRYEICMDNLLHERGQPDIQNDQIGHILCEACKTMLELLEIIVNFSSAFHTHRRQESSLYHKICSNVVNSKNGENHILEGFINNIRRKDLRRKICDYILEDNAYLSQNNDVKLFLIRTKAKLNPSKLISPEKKILNSDKSAVGIFLNEILANKDQGN